MEWKLLLPSLFEGSSRNNGLSGQVGTQKIATGKLTGEIISNKSRTFEIWDSVYAHNFRRGDKWLRGVVKRKLKSVM